MSNATDELQQQAKDQSTHTFTTALWLNAAVFALEIGAFTILRRQFKAIYEPRTYIPPEEKRSEPLGTSLLTWPLKVWQADYHRIKHQNGMDAYFYVRFLRMMLKVFVPIWLVSWVVLLPITSANSNSGKSGLDRFTFGNIGPDMQTRYAAHIILVWLFTIWICYNIKNEMRHFVTARQQYLVSPEHSSSAQANTVLITGVPTRYLTEKAITRLFSYVPGGVRKVWLNRDLKDLPDLYDLRLKACNRLESAETQLLNTATKMHSKKLKSEAKAAKKSGKEKESFPLEPYPTGADVSDREKAVSLAEGLVPRSERPTHRLPVGPLPFSLPLLGEKVDSIEWARETIHTTTEALERGRTVLRREELIEEGQRGKVGGIAGIVGGVGAGLGIIHMGGRKSGADDTVEGDVHGHALEKVMSHGKKSASMDEHVDHDATSFGAGKVSGEGEGVHLTRVHTPSVADEGQMYPPLNSAFVLFHQQVGAHLAAQALAHHEPYRMATKYSEVAPADVIWGNLGLNPYEIKVRQVISYAITAGLIILWAIPVAFVGTVSNVASLCATYHWLAWLCKLPNEVLGIIQGILPPVLLAVLMMLLPIILRILATFEGIPRRSGVELDLMWRYFLFQIVHSFLVVTLSSGIIAALPSLVNNPTSIPGLLASNLPRASTFFLTYIILQGLSGTASGFLQIVPLILYYVKLFVLGSTPRSVYDIKYTLRDIQWGTLFPATTLVVVITIAYSVISPIINGLAVATFFLFYQMWKYLFLYQLEQPASGDTGGLFFPKAIQQVFVGMYIQQICLAALFFLARDDRKKASAVPEGALMVVLIGFTLFFHMIIYNSYGPLIHSLPLSLADKSYGMPRHSDEMSLLLEEHRDEGFGGEAGETKLQEAVEADVKAKTAEENEAHSHDSHSSHGDVFSKQPVVTTDDITDDNNNEKGSPSHPILPPPADDGPTDFYHPASAEPLRTIWIPQDTLGLARGEVAANISFGIDASCDHAYMDSKGHVDIDGHPPSGTV